MAVSNIKATFQCDIKIAWETVTSLENYTWRSDLSKIEVLNDKQFVEYTKGGVHHNLYDYRCGAISTMGV